MAENIEDTKSFKIQSESIPHALEGKDLIAVAQTGSGKTGAFSIPILKALLETPKAFFCLCTLADKIAEQFEALGSSIGVKCAVVATPGRLLDHLSNTKGFSLRTLKYLVLDEADRLLDEDFGNAIDALLSVIPRDRKTYLFSATMTDKVQKLQRSSMRNPVKIEASSKYSTVVTLKQQYCFVPAKYKAKRLGALNKFKAGECNILVCTDVASRGLDIPSVDMVINFDIPTNSKDYIHRVGRTARAGRSGVAISLVNQHEVEWYFQIEKLIGKKLPEFPAREEEVLLLLERVSEAKRISNMKIKETGGRKKRKGGGDDGEEEIERYLAKNRKSSKKAKKR